MTVPAAQESPRPALARALAVVAALLVVLVLVQAALAGQALFGTGDIEIHGYLGNASFVLGLAGAVLAFAARLPGWQVSLSVVLLATLFAQTGLGYVGRESTAAASWHIPLGVAIFGLAVLQAYSAASSSRR